MATSSLADSYCVTCNKAMGTFTCRGCEQNFCIIHANEHRQMLSLQMDQDVVSSYDQLQQNIIEQTRESIYHPLIKQIDQWENDSIEKIRQSADQNRKELFNIIEKHKNKIKEDLEDISIELKKARHNDHFFETDLKKWIKQLNESSNKLNTPPSIHIQLDNNINSFISNIFIRETNEIEDEYFDQSIGNIQITENGKVISHNQTNSYTSVRGKRLYSQGQHRIRFQIEHLTNNWVFFGIVSLDGLIPDYPSIGKTAYGWSGSNNVWCNGIRASGFNNYKSDFEINDKIELLINCDERIIELTNERTQNKHILNIDQNDSPFPWKINIGFFHSPGERIRLI